MKKENTMTKQQKKPTMSKASRGSEGKRPNNKNNNIDLSDSIILRDILSPKRAQIQAKLTQSQQKIMEDELEKMIKVIKTKFKAKNDFNELSHENKSYTKTKRFEFFENCNNSQTIRKINLTDRVSKNSKNNNKAESERIKIFSPRALKKNKQKKKRNISETTNSQQQQFISPSKNKGPKTKNITSPCKSIKAKKVKLYCQNNYYLMGDNFIEINQKDSMQLACSMLEQQKINNYSPQCQQITGIMRLQSSNSQQLSTGSHVVNPEPQLAEYQNQIFLKESKSDSIKEKMIKNHQNKVQNEQKIKQNNQQYEKNLRKIDEGQNKYLQIFSNYSDFQTIELSSIESYDAPELVRSHLPENSIHQLEKDCPKQSESLLDVRLKAINLQMKTNCGILEKLLKSNKINQDQYQSHLDIMMEKYDNDVTQVEKLKDLLAVNEMKIETIVNQTQSVVDFAKQIENQPQTGIKLLENIFGSLIIQNQNKNAQLFKLTQKNKFQQGNQEFLSHEQIRQEIQTNQDKMLIEQRISQQIGLQQVNLQPVNTSILGIFQYIKKLYRFVLNNYKEEMLKYLNMPYGYNIHQRLLYMQGYDTLQDEKEDTLGIIYGIQEVMSPCIFQQYFKHLQRYCQDKLEKSIFLQKVHCRAIFDAINEAMNEYRPYFFVNGPPYSWVTSEKTLTFFYISEENLEEVLQKVQFEVLKWSSSLCGLIVPELMVSQSGSDEQKKIETISQIFENYSQSIHQKLMDNRQQRAMKAQFAQIMQKNYEWNIFQEQKTAVLYEISSMILEQVSSEIAIFMSKRQLCSRSFSYL